MKTSKLIYCEFYRTRKSRVCVDTLNSVAVITSVRTPHYTTSVSVDIRTDPPNITKLNTGMDTVNRAGRNYLAGEYDWTGLKGGDDIVNWFTAIYNSPGAGDLFWSLFGRTDSCCSYVEHNDGQSFFYQRQGAPAGSGWPADIFTRRGRILAAHANNMAGRSREISDPARIELHVDCICYSSPRVSNDLLSTDAVPGGLATSWLPHLGYPITATLFCYCIRVTHHEYMSSSCLIRLIRGVYVVHHSNNKENKGGKQK